MAQFLRDPEVISADVIAIQEPWENPYKNDTHHPLKQTHELLFPQDERGRARVCIFISKQMGEYTHLAHSRDCQEIHIKIDEAELRLINIYNDRQQATALGILQNILLPSGMHRQQEVSYLVLGDFNLHHPVWGGDDALRDAKAEDLLDLMEMAGLDSWLAPGTVTRDQAGSQSTIDLVLASYALREQILVCEVDRDVHADSDHLPILTLLEINVPEAADPVKRRNWKAMDVEKFMAFVSVNLQDWMRQVTSPHDIDRAIDHLLDTIHRAAQESTPWARRSTWARQGWTPECTEAIKTARRQYRRYTRTHDEEDWKEYTLARNAKGRVIGKALKQGFRQWVRETVERGPRGLWKVSKWARNRDQGPTSSNIPTLHSPEGRIPAETNQQKVDLLRQVFFPQPPQADLSDIESTTTSPPNQLTFPAISQQEVSDIIKRAPPDKAPGEDGIPNRVWKILAENDHFVAILTAIFDACMRTGHNPRHFQASITVTLRKGGPRDFRMPKSYRPVALLNTLGKILESVVATRIAWAVEEHGLLPRTHLGGRKGISVDHAIQLILERIHRAWGRGQKASMLLLDVAGAYDNVSHERLLYNIKQLRLGQFGPWIASFLSNRSTRIKLPGYLSDSFPTPTGIPQGSPISPILFLLFNAPLITACGLRTGAAQSIGFGWVDDVAVLVESDSFYTNTITLEKILDKASLWAKRHAARFAPDKFELIHFTNPNETDTTQNPTTTNIGSDIFDFAAQHPEGNDQMPVQHDNLFIQPTQSAKYLGVWLDKHLDFNTHRQKLLAKANGSLEALRAMTGSVWGASLMAMRRVYQAVVVPQMLYGVSAWHCPTARSLPAWEMKRVVNEFTKIQRRAAILISGAFKSTSAAALNIELFLTPIHLLMDQIIQETAIRIQTGAAWAQPDCLRRQRSPQETRRGGWSPLEALRWKKDGILNQQGTWESRKAFILAPWEARIPCFIDQDAEAARASHDKIESLQQAAPDRPKVFFTDGSGYEGMVGASAVAPREGVFQRRHLGTTDDSTVYVAELNGVEMAIASFVEQNQQRDNSRPTKLVIFSDCQAAIQAVQNPKRSSGQFVLSAIYNHVRTLRSLQQTPTFDQIPIEIRWIPAHVGVPGNETADVEAKLAATGGVGNGADQPRAGDSASGSADGRVLLAATAKRRVRRRIKERWAQEWAKERTGKPNQRLVKAPDKKVLRLFESLSKPYTSILIQMRSMRIALNHFLFKIKAVESDQCYCGEGSQTPRHILMQCPLYADLRKTFLEKISLTDRGNSTDYDAIVSHSQATRYVAEFMLQTGLLGQFRHVEIEPELTGDENNKPG
ncbi:putative reverse transcriptase [Penicillium brasilianum]|uniref:Putative reverse transcriptase n=1 Tax=Penicillium brasilianum TaxID=104259 RepID=A0A1S9RB36_PENBI|nr:putative reverse transcriptase [Penicillium brasilianum]